MAMKSAGRVSIRVLPDSTGFRRDLKTTLDRIEKSVKARIPVELVLGREQLAKIKSDIESLRIKLKPSIELVISPEQIAKMKAQIERVRPTVHVNLATAEAAAQIEALTRTRDMTINANIDETMWSRLEGLFRDQQMHIRASVDSARARVELAALTRPRSLSIRPHLDGAAFAGIVAKLTGLAGLNVLGDAWRDGVEFIHNIDRMAVKIGELSLVIAGISSVIVSAIGNLMVAGADLLAIGNIAWLAPGFLTGIGISLGIMAVALSDMGNRLSDLGPKMGELKKSIQDTFWAEADKPIRSMFDNIFPRLFSTEGKMNTAAELGKFFGEIAASIERNLPPGLLETMFDRMNKAIAISTQAIDPLMHAFITMGEVGSRFFERFSTWIVKISNQFDDFVTKSAGNGDMESWIERGIQSLKDLGSLIYGTTRFMTELTDAFRESGAKGLGEWAKDINTAADALARPEFKDPLVSFFTSMRVGAEGVTQMISNMGRGLSEFVQGPVKWAMLDVKEIFAGLGKYIGDTLLNKEFQAGFEAMFDGFRVGFENLAPAVKPTADSLGNVMKLLGKISKAVGDLLSTFMVEWGPVIDDIGDKFGELIDPLSRSLQNMFRELKPVLEGVRDYIVTPVVNFIKDSLLPLFDELVKKMPAVIPLLEGIGKLIDNGLGPAVDAIVRLLQRTDTKDIEGMFAVLGDILEEVGNIIAEIVTSLDNLDVSEISNGLKVVRDTLVVIRDIAKGIGDSLQWLDKMGTALNAWASIQWGGKAGQIKGSGGPFEDMKKEIDGFVKWLYEVDAWMRPGFDAIKNSFTKYDWAGMWDKGLKGLEKSWNDFWGSFDIAAKFEKMKRDVGRWWDDLFNYKPKFSGGGGGFSIIQKQQLTFLQQMHKDWDEFWASVSEKWTAFWDGLKTKLDTFWNGALLFLAMKYTEIKTGFDEWVAGMVEGWNGFWGGLDTKVRETWEGMKLFLAMKYLEITTGIQEWFAGLGESWNGFWAGVGTTVQTTWDTIKIWIATKIAEIKMGIAVFIAETKANWDAFWTGIAVFVATKWQEMKNSIAAKYNEIKAGISNWIGEVRGNLQRGWDTAVQNARSGWEQMVQAIRDKINNAVSEVRNLPGRIQQALGDLSNRLRGSGQSLIGGFIGGMNDMIQNARNTAAGIVAAVRNFFPFSPAKEGPFSGMGYTSFSGKALVKDFAGGMMANMNLARDAAKQVAEAASFGSSLDLEADIGDQGITIDRRSVKVDIHNPVAEPSSKTITTASNRLTMRKK